MDKVRLRHKLNIKLSKLSSSDKFKRDARIVHNLQQLRGLQNAKIVAAYCPRSNEIDIRPLFNWLHQRRAQIALPLQPYNTIRFSPLSSTNFPISTYKKPLVISKTTVTFSHIDVILVPLVGFDQHRNRLGRGMGYYDRLIKTCGPQVLCIGVGYELQKVAEIPTEPHDEQLDFIVTEDGVTKNLH
jgi:5-formyltetrahydrofolate cyclo-ligase